MSIRYFYQAKAFVKILVTKKKCSTRKIRTDRRIYSSYYLYRRFRILKRTDDLQIGTSLPDR